MIVRPIDLGMIQQMNDASQIKQNENNKPAVEQQNITVQVQKETDNKSEQVTTKDNADNADRKYDSKDKSDNEYFDDKSRHGKRKNEDGKVIVKNVKEIKQFDIKI